MTLPLVFASLLASVASVASVAMPATQSLDACETKRLEDPEHWRGYTCIYVYARKTGDYDGAIAKARALARDEPERTWARYILADLLMDSGQEGADTLYREVSEEFAEAGDFESATLSRIAFAFSFDPQSKDAIDRELEHASVLAQKSGSPALEAQVRVQHARLMLRRGGPLGQVEKLLAEAREVTFPEGPYEQKKHLLFMEADLQQALDRPEVALATLGELGRMAAKQDDRYVTASVEVRRLSMLVEYPSLRRESLDALSKRLDAVEPDLLDGNPFARSQYLCLRGDLAASPRAARPHYSACEDLARDVGAFDAVRSAQHGLALVDGDPSLLESSRRLARTHGRHGLFSLQLMARARFASGDRPGGLDATRDVLDEVDRLSVRQGHTLIRAQMLSPLAPYYDELASWVLEEGPPFRRDNVEQALQIIERLRARTIADALQRARVELPDIDDAQYASIGREIAEVNTLLRDEALEDAERARLLSRLTTLERNEAALFDAWAADHPVSRLASGDVSLTALQDALGAEHALVSFQLARSPYGTRWESIPSRSWVVVVTADSVRVHPLPERAHIEPIADLFVGSFHDASSAASLGEGLHRMVFEDVLEDLPPTIERLTIVPDGNLHRVPFSAVGPAGGPMLGERFSVSRAPSLALWLRLRQEGAASGRRALAFVGPDVPDRALAPLTMALQEGQALASVVDTELLSGAQASEAFFADTTMHGLSIVHFGAHAIVDDEHPDRAAIVLAPGRPEHDGLLLPRELAAKEFAGVLVVLAACRGAAGPIVAEEGPLGLAHALFRGGARTVVASLWPLEDAAATEFFTRFYGSLGEGLCVSEAVAAVRRELRAQGQPASAWAGVIVLGDGEHVPLPREPNTRHWLSWGAAGLAAISWIGLLFRRRRSGR